MNVYFTLFNRKNSLQKLKRCIKIYNLSNNIKRSLCFSFIDNIHATEFSLKAPAAFCISKDGDTRTQGAVG